MQSLDLTDAFIPFPTVKAAVGLSRSSIYEKISEGSFPAPVKIGRASRWSTAELQTWMERKRAERNSAAQVA